MNNRDLRASHRFVKSSSELASSPAERVHLAPMARTSREASRARQVWVVRVLLALALVYALSPFWVSLRPPMQDLPQHLAAGRVLLEGANPQLGFDVYFTTEWLRSQYLGIYVLLGAFFYPASWLTEDPLLWATRLSIVVLAATWVFGAEALYRRMTGRRGLGVWSLVLFFNVHLILGFLNFLLGVSFAFIMLACYASLRSSAPRWDRKDWRFWALAASALACFYFHVVPFGVACAVMVGAAAFDQVMRWWGTRRCAGPTPPHACWTSYLALTPAALATLFWLLTPAGLSTREAASGGGSRGKAHFLSFDANHQALPSWTLDAFRSEWDMRWLTIALVGLGVYAAIQWCLTLPWLQRTLTRGNHAVETTEHAPAFEKDVVLLTMLRVAGLGCVCAYYVLPSSYDWIWPINARFPVLALLLLPFWLPTITRMPSKPLYWVQETTHWAAIALLLGSSVGVTSIARTAFDGFAQELDGFDEILEELPEGQRVATLVFDRGSRHIGFSPFLHIGAYAQAERGGVAFFSFNDFPQSPVRFNEDNRPPRVAPRWEWKPERVRPDRDLSWFDYLLVRGGPAELRDAQDFELVSTHRRFRLFRRTP